MALSKKITDERGIVATYHKIGPATLQEGVLAFELHSYTTPEYRRKAEPVLVFSFSYHITLEEEESMGIRKLCYAKIKEEDFWQDAEDC